MSINHLSDIRYPMAKIWQASGGRLIVAKDCILLNSSFLSPAYCSPINEATERSDS